MTIGAYDGVHLGHRALLAELASRAEADGLTTAVVTFDRHPATVVRPESAPQLLCDLDQKLELLESAGVDRTVVVPFDEERANETAEEFVERILVERLEPGWWWWGRTSTSATGARATWPCSGRWGPTAGFDVDGVSLRADGGPGEPRPSPSPPPGSATWWRRAGWRRRPSCWAGPTRSGARWSTAITGAGPSWASPPPTWTSPTSICLPAAGIYAGWYERPDGSRMAGGHLGRAPAHLLRGRRRPAGRGLPARLLRRPLRRGGPGVLRVPPARRGGLRPRWTSSSPRWSGTWPSPGSAWIRRD